jgi:hypothetical protein
MRFGASIINQGEADLEAGDPALQPGLFEYDSCRQRYELAGGVTRYTLREYSSGAVLGTQSAHWCFRDTSQYLQGPSVECGPVFTCSNQGIQAGWADDLANTLDCQWLVLGEPAIPLKEWYRLELCVNPGRVFHEYSFDNNCVEVPVWIPSVRDDGQIVRYVDIHKPQLP